MFYGSPIAGLATRIPEASAQHGKIFITIHAGLLVLCSCLVVSAYLVGARASQIHVYRLIASLFLLALHSLLETIHWVLLLGKKLPKQGNTTYNLRLVLSSLLLSLSALAMLVAVLDVLHNRLLAVLRGDMAAKVLRWVHLAFAGALAALAFVEFVLVANWAGWVVTMKSERDEVPAGVAWARGVTFSSVQEVAWFLVMLWVAVASLVGFRFAKKRGAYTQNLFGLIFVGILIAFTKICTVAVGEFAVFAHWEGSFEDESRLPGMMVAMLVKTTPLLFAYVSLVVMAKRPHEFIASRQEMMDDEKARQHEADRTRDLA